MKTVFTHTIEGHTQTRKSPRVYTHAIVGRRDYDKFIRTAGEGANYSIRVNWEYCSRCAAATVGQIDINISRYPVDQRMVDFAKEFFASYGTNIEEAVARKTAELVAKYTAEKVVAAGLPPVILQWSQSLKNASKAANTFLNKGWLDVKVVTVNRK